MINGDTGEEANIVYGVPTGSVYGPVGYTMHVNSISNVVEHCSTYMYADDTCLVCADRDVAAIEQKMQSDINNILKWAHDNGIILNVTKTKCMLINSPKIKIPEETSCYGVKQILDTTNECLSALTNMNIDVSSWDLIIIHLVIQKLDQKSRKLWEHKISDNSDTLPTFSEFSTFLESRFRALEFLDPSNKRETKPKEAERPKVFSVTTTALSISCPCCAEAHLLYQCKRFSQDSVQQRRDFVKNKALCFNCFGAKHSATQCKRDTSCKRCGRRHHSLLHLDSEHPPSVQPSRLSEGEKIHGKQREGIQEKPEQREPVPSNIVAHAAEGSSMPNSVWTDSDRGYGTESIVQPDSTKHRSGLDPVRKNTSHSWDQEVTSNLLTEWNEFREQLPVLNSFIMPRWVGLRQDASDIQLHGYCDASNDAYAAVVYLRVVDHEGNVTVHLVAARTKVSPIRQISIPRLELSGAVLLSKLLGEVSAILSIPVSCCRAWTDSTIVLAWLQGEPSRWTTFVANRVTDILSILNNDQWAHVESTSNPADCASRGMSPADFIQFELWVHGPAWLQDPNYQHPTSETVSTELEAKPMKVHVCTVLSTDQPSEELSVWTKYSSLSKTVRVVAYCLRFCKKLKGESFQSYLTARELDNALKVGIKASQSSAFSRELTNLNNSNPIPRRSIIVSLCPFLDEDGIMRTRGRIEHSDHSYNVKHPIIMPHDHHLSKLIVSDAHTRTLHGGPQLTLNYVRSKFLILNAKSLIRHILSKCVRCIKYKATKNQPFMADLPSTRVTIARPFHRTGCDYAGPINIRISKGRGCKSYKGYIALFVCMVTRCIHLEAVSSLTTEGFLAAYRRFVARRGPCKEIWSDNGSNFVGASKELRVLFQQSESSVMKEVAEALANEGTEWHFIPPRAPNFGGLWEAGVASTKYHLKRVLDGTTLTFEELSTVLVQAEACLNSRPMYQLPSNEVDTSPLTPGHFLVGEALVTAPDRNYEDSQISPLHRWQLTQKLMQQFWRKWSQEYLTTLYQRYKWTKVTPEPQVGDVVLVKEDDLPPSKWLYGLVQEKHPGPDNVTRVVTLKCNHSKLVRPVSKLIVLPAAN
ncbi:uncharacterized protein LOC134795200 [Cydia splendana]|uniref:uncharacterized protein LOC134795200 n=1 Tax=Cydia splendana TaxID=1100963 RepID=UPI00300C0F3A